MEILLDGSKSNGKLELNVGDSLMVNLMGNPTTGYQWQVASLSSEVLDWTEGPTYQPSTPGRIGSGGIFRFGFKAVRKGRATVKLVYRRSWEEGVPPIKTEVLKVKVK
jgi:inhibitor of cysteine peptidase